MRTIEHVVSRHHPAFVVPALHLGLGRNDKVYLVLGGRQDGQALRLASDGSAQRFGRVGYAALAITATADGVIATAETHFPHRIDFWDREFNPLGSIDDFTANDTDGYYAAFRGWTWGANWWVGAIGAGAAENQAERDRYTDALKTVEEPGGWVPVLDTVTDRSIGLRTKDAARFREVLNERFPGQVSAVTGPYRAPQTLPPVVFAPADEVDLHYQGEQLQLLGATAHMVDYYRRPGKPAWGHPELFNDDGTGGMILPTLLQQVMRGANGTGMTGDQGAYHLEGITALDERGAGSGGRPGDPRSGGAGRTSMLRAAFDLCTRLGPTTAGARSADRVAIVVSARMQRLETWQGLSSKYFLRLFEAYTACLYAHRPASFVFTEDVSADVLRRYDAILLIGQRTDLDPRLATALTEVGQGPDAVPVYADDSCVQRHRDAYRPLGTAFTHVESDETPQSDDASYYRLRRVFLDQAAKVTVALKDVVTPVAECDNPEVWLSEWKAGSTTYSWGGQQHAARLGAEPRLARGPAVRPPGARDGDAEGGAARAAPGRRRAHGGAGQPARRGVHRGSAHRPRPALRRRPADTRPAAAPGRLRLRPARARHRGRRRRPYRRPHRLQLGPQPLRPRPRHRHHTLAPPPRPPFRLRPQRPRHRLRRTGLRRAQPRGLPPVPAERRRLAPPPLRPVRPGQEGHRLDEGRVGPRLRPEQLRSRARRFLDRHLRRPGPRALGRPGHRGAREVGARVVEDRRADPAAAPRPRRRHPRHVRREHHHRTRRSGRLHPVVDRCRRRAASAAASSAATGAPR
ncbi:hypothetical protein ACRJ4W_20830 [Streptomyces sp. GLT-R25]